MYTLSYCFVTLLLTVKHFSLGLSSSTTSATMSTATDDAHCEVSPTLAAAPAILDLASLLKDNRNIDNGNRKPIVYTLAGSDSGGGAGIQADLHAIHALGGHGCSLVTCLTAQNSVGVTAVQYATTDFVQAQWDALVEDMPPAAIKIGMLGTKELAEQVGRFVQSIKEQQSDNHRVWVVLDPVMISTSGHRLIQADAQQAMIDGLFPYVDLITPNKFEAEALLGRTFTSTADVERGASDLLALGAQAVLIKGGHMEEDSPHAQDYFLSSVDADDLSAESPRLCDGGVWLRSPRYDTVHTHGTGCTLSSALATALALKSNDWPTIVDMVDATTLAKAYVTAGIAAGVGLGQGPGPVGHTVFPQSYSHFPRIVADPNTAATPPTFASVSMGRLLILVDSLEWIERLVQLEGRVTDIQLRIKGETDFDKIVNLVKRANQLCQSANIRLWINDYWQEALAAGCFGVHMGQEDLYRCRQQGGLTQLQEAGMALGLSTHTYAELAAALAVGPSYISLGPIFGTASKTVNFGPQGLAMVQQWRSLVPPHMPLVVIGGITDANRTADARQAGADCVAVIGAITNANDPTAAIATLTSAMEA